MSKEMTIDSAIGWLRSLEADSLQSEYLGEYRKAVDMAIEALKKKRDGQQGCDISECQWFTCEDCTLYTEICGNMEKNKLCGVFERGQCLECYKGQGWIPTSERLPNRGGRYLIQQEGTFEYIGISKWCPYEKCWYDDVDSAKENEQHMEFVITWMPLPEPYRPREE